MNVRASMSATESCQSPFGQYLRFGCRHQPAIARAQVNDRRPRKPPAWSRRRVRPLHRFSVRTSSINGRSAAVGRRVSIRLRRLQARTRPADDNGSKLSGIVPLLLRRRAPEGFAGPNWVEQRPVALLEHVALGEGRPRLQAERNHHPVVAVIAEQHKPGEYADRSAVVGADPPTLSQERARTRVTARPRRRDPVHSSTNRSA